MWKVIEPSAQKPLSSAGCSAAMKVQRGLGMAELHAGL